ncbi:MAG: cytochrome P450, partial [Blastococcus sp.]|nr:cytochrome P450 [Blastococcus sp.]
MTVDDRFTDSPFQKADPAELTRFEVMDGPVSDWATDFSHMDEQYAENAHEIWDDLRGRCPVAHTERFGGAWL